MSRLTDWVHSCPLVCQDKEALSSGGLQLWGHGEQTGKPLGALEQGSLCSFFYRGPGTHLGFLALAP